MASLKGGVESWTGRNWAVRKRGGEQVCTWDAWNSSPVRLSLIHSCKIRIKDHTSSLVSFTPIYAFLFE